MSTAVPKTTGFRPDGIKSSGMAAHNPWQAAATAAAEKSRRDQVWVFRQPVLFFGPAASRGGEDRSGRHRWGFRRNG